VVSTPLKPAPHKTATTTVPQHGKIDLEKRMGGARSTGAMPTTTLQYSGTDGIDGNSAAAAERQFAEENVQRHRRGGTR